jgi:Flp pilus assembly protein TadG
VTRTDEGSAVVEFVLVSVVVVALVLALVQLAYALYERNTLVADAQEGARFAATANQSPDRAVPYTQDLVAQTLPSGAVEQITAGYDDVAGVPTVVVEIRAALPVFGWLGPRGTLVVRGHAVVEQP